MIRSEGPDWLPVQLLLKPGFCQEPAWYHISWFLRCHAPFGGEWIEGWGCADMLANRHHREPLWHSVWALVSSCFGVKTVLQGWFQTGIKWTSVTVFQPHKYPNSFQLSFFFPEMLRTACWFGWLLGWKGDQTLETKSTGLLPAGLFLYLGCCTTLHSGYC